MTVIQNNILKKLSLMNIKEQNKKDSIQNQIIVDNLIENINLTFKKLDEEKQFLTIIYQ
jgi:hypothetical protein